jgi:hypothetical protein
MSYHIDRDIEFDDIMKVAHELVQSVANMSNRSHKNQFFGEMIRLTELVKGNLEAVNGMSLGIWWIVIIFACIIAECTKTQGLGDDGSVSIAV